MIRLRMVRAHLRDLPVHPLPPPWLLRPYRPGDEEIWVQIQQAADRHQPITQADFMKSFGEDRGALADRMLFLCDASGRAVGTTTAWFGDAGVDGRQGRVHWVAIVPEMQGRGLGRPLLAATCRRLVELGHASAFLTTADVRARAIRLYLDFGFVPEIRSEEERAAWERLREQGLPVP